MLSIGRYSQTCPAGLLPQQPHAACGAAATALPRLHRAAAAAADPDVPPRARPCWRTLPRRPLRDPVGDLASHPVSERAPGARLSQGGDLGLGEG